MIYIKLLPLILLFILVGCFKKGPSQKYLDCYNKAMAADRDQNGSSYIYGYQKRYAQHQCLLEELKDSE